MIKSEEEVREEEEIFRVKKEISLSFSPLVFIQSICFSFFQLKEILRV